MNPSSYYEPARNRRPQFWRLAMRCTQIAATVDIAFFFLFLWLGSPILAWINIISIALYAGAYYAFKYRRNRLAVALIWVEVLGHAALGITMIGWDSGFHYYLLMFIPAISVAASKRSAAIALSVLWAYYVGLDVLMWNIEPVQPISETALHLVQLFNLTVVFAMFSYLASYYLQMVVRAQRKLKEMATTDPLTGLFNRRHMQFLAESELARFERSGHPVSFLLLDADYFKAINDKYGHETGDQVLVTLSRLIRDELRTQDLVARWGGEEFLVLLPDTRADSARGIAERIRASLESFPWKQVADQNLVVTLSAGISELREGDDLNSVINRADHALYRGKGAGRNRVELETLEVL